MDGVVDLLGQHATAWMLVLARVGGVFLYAPLLSSASVPVQARGLLACALAAALYPALLGAGTAPAGSVDLATMGVLVVGEALVGLVLGALAAIPVLAAQVGGVIMGQQLGLGLATVYNPAFDAESDVMGELLMYLALGIFIAAGGLEVLLITLARTYERVPVGGFGTAEVGSALEVMTGLLRSGFELALRVSAPVLCILTLETLASSFIMRTVPQLNVMTIGFAVKVIVGMAVFITAIYAVADAVGGNIERGMRAVLMWGGGG